MTTVRVPVRIRLDLTGDALDTHLLDTVRDAVAAGTARAVDRARGVAALRQAVWADEPPDVRIRFRGDAPPAWAAAHLEVSAHAAVQTAATALRSGGAGSSAPVRMTRRLRQFASDEDMVDAVRDQLGDQPETIVVAADGDGTGLMRFVTRGPDGFLGVTRRITLNHWVLPADDKDAVRVSGYGGWRADSLHFYADADSPALMRQRLAELWVGQLRAANPRLATSVLVAKANRLAAKFTNVTGTLYELRAGDQPVRTYIGAHGLTQDRLPVLVLTEEVAVGTSSLNDQYGRNCPPLEYDPRAAENANPDKPFVHELALSDWDTETYARFSDLITVVVVQLGLPWPRFAGSFILDTLTFIRQISESLGALETTGLRQDRLRRLVTALDAVNTLMFAYTKAVLARDRAKKLPCPLAGHAEEWAGFLHRAYFPSRRDTVAALFIAACQDALLAVLERSAADIAHRLASTDWLAATRTVLTSLLTTFPELTDMLTKLRSARDYNVSTGGIDAGPTASYFHNGAQVLRTPVDPDSPPGFGPVRTVYRIQDAAGVWHRLEEVEAAVKSQRTEAFLVDPFLEKLADIPEVIRRLRVARQLDSTVAGAAVSAGVDREFMAVLGDLQRLNQKHTDDARTDRSIAYGLATFESDSRKDIHEKLSGVHHEADELLRGMFQDKEIYDDGLTALAHQAISKRNFEEFLNFVGLPLLAVFFPGVALVIGLAQAAGGVATAADHAELQRSMLAGDDILSRAQVEAERVSALIQGFLAVAPELGGMARGAVTGFRALAEGELTEVTLAAFRRKMAEIVSHLAEATVARLAVNFLAQAASGYVLNLVLSEVIGELAQSMAAEYLPGGTVSREELPEFVRRTIGAAMSANGEAP